MTLALYESPCDDLDELEPQATSLDTVKVLHVINGEHYAGAERVQDLLALTLPEFGYSADFACLKPGKFAAARRATGARLFALPMRHPLDLRPAFRLARLARRGGYALLHSHTPRAALIGRLAARLAGLPLVHHVHSPTVADTTHRAKRWLNGLSEWATIHRSAALITVSRTLQDYVERRGLSARVVRVVHNGVPSAGPLRDREPPHGAWTLGMIALFRPRKGIEILLQALAQLRGDGNELRLRAVGQFETPAYEREIQALVDRLELREAIDWTGFTTNVAEELQHMDLFVLPSLFGEGLPMVVLEAMAAGIPIVATRVEGVPEAICDGIDGLLAEPNDVASLAAQLRRIIAGEVEWSQLRDHAHRRQADEFSDRAMAAGVAAVYSEVLAGC
ncbi:MAG TPA: glycosyltransferase [Pirellulales bacterium]|jgi:glycosyltransferase involved in cell wall biosynthesis|nr:glycosyltransferase [Pirellulales bacterium]